MPVFKSGEGQAPSWCEMESFEIVHLSAGSAHTFERRGRKEKLIVASGVCTIRYGGRAVRGERGTNLDIETVNDRFDVTDVIEGATLVRLCGRWGDEVGGSGLFFAVESENPSDAGDPFSYPKRTAFDRHYHDCDEYWVIYEGCGTVVSEGKSYPVGPGDCVATGMGHHHDFPEVSSPIKAAFFETTLEGRKRTGHLWEHTHGLAEPRPERV